ncbi:hypothetical protein OKW21_003779 [Catalinimonas alkaloidigena]|nr:hypothetical protein [Catalinimonas alkaloidigena]
MYDFTKKAYSDIRREPKVLSYAKKIGNESKAYHDYGISCETCYHRSSADECGLINGKPCPKNQKLCTSLPVEELLIHLRKTYYLGQGRIKWHDSQVSENGYFG